MRWALVAVPTLLVLLTGCGPEPEQPRSPSPFAACPVGATSEGDFTLPCFTGDVPVALEHLGKPAVINLWASWCGPCLLEMPELQAFADEVGDGVLVLGVNSGDSWESAVAWAGELGVTYPNVFDPHSTFKAELGVQGLPSTLFVGADGRVRHTESSGGLTRETLRALVAQHLG
jgi:thiol-disulfide isomerase/thioredoxin